MSDDRRTASRTPVTGVVVRVRFQNKRQLKQLWAKDISKGGIFLRTATPLPVFEKVTVILELPDQATIDLHGSVVHVIPPERASDKTAAGMGVQFTDLTPEKRAILESFLERNKTAVPKVTKPGILSSRLVQLNTEAFVHILRRLLWLAADPEVLAAQDYYAIIGVPASASAADIAEACSVLKILTDPHTAPDGLSADDNERIFAVHAVIGDIEATLTDQVKRMEYDGGRGILR